MKSNPFGSGIKSSEGSHGQNQSFSEKAIKPGSSGGSKTLTGMNEGLGTGGKWAPLAEMKRNQK